MHFRHGVHWSKCVPPQLYFLVSAVFHYLGPAFAILLFAYVDALGVAWMRIAGAALVFAVWRRPWRAWASQTRTQQRLLVLFGTILGLMNASFYLAIARLPLATVGTIEFAGPIAIAAWGSRTRRNIAALLLAVCGVSLLLERDLGGGTAAGYSFAFANCVLFMGYVVLGHHVAQDGGAAGIDRLALAMLIAALIVSPLGLAQAAIAFGQPLLLLAGVGVGVCSSVLPYVCDQLAMARLSRATFALLLALLPASAAVIGALVLQQIPTIAEGFGIVLVAIGVALRQER